MNLEAESWLLKFSDGNVVGDVLVYKLVLFGLFVGGLIALGKTILCYMSSLDLKVFLREIW